jgi:hypothetical protein
MLIEAIWNRISEVAGKPYFMVGNVAIFKLDGSNQVRLFWQPDGIDVRYFKSTIVHAAFYKHCFADPSADPESIVKTVANDIVNSAWIKDLRG